MTESALDRAMDAIAPAMQGYVAERHEAVLLVGLTHRGERCYRAFRTPGAALATDPTPDSIFEIGSVSKVFSTSLLMVMEQRGMLSLTDTIDQFLPQLTLSPEIAEITLFDLATHTSGFDRLGKILAKMYEQDVRVMYLRYSAKDLYKELELAELVRPRGSGWEYSIPGMGLLGHILELVGGKPWEELLREMVTGPLGLDDTAYELTDEQLARVVRGYDEKGEPACLWYWDVTLSQGGLRSSIADLLTFAEANVADDGAEVTTAMRRARRTHFTWPEGYELEGAPGVAPPFQQAIGWRSFPWAFGTVDEHGGSTLSAQAQVGVCEDTQSGFAAAVCYDRAGWDAMIFPVVVVPAMRTALQVLSEG